MTLTEAITNTGIAEASFDSYDVVVREDEEAYADVFNVSISRLGMPPHFSQNFSTIEEAEKYLAEETFLPVQLDWQECDGE